MKKGLLSFLLVMITISLTGCGTDEYVDPLADGVLTVGMEADYAPYNWTTTEEQGSEYAYPISGSNAYADGYDVMIAQKIADSLGVELEIKKVSWDGLIPGLQSGDLDLVIAGMSPTEERKEQINFTEAYYESNPEQAIVVRTDSQYANAQTLSDFSGANISAQQGTFQVNLLEQLELSDDATVPLPDYDSLLTATLSGSIDGYIAELPVAKTQSQENNELVYIVPNPGFALDESYTTSAIGIAKGNEELVTQVNDALAEIDAQTREDMMQEATELSGVEA